MRRWVAACLAGVMIMGSVTSAQAAEPWALEDGVFMASDGKTIIDGALEKGISISKYQNRAGDINWKKLASQDITFAMIRLGDADEKDPFFDINMESADSHRLKMGVVYSSKALTKEKIKAEAAYVLDEIRTYSVSYPVALDVDSQYMISKGLEKQEIVEVVNAFCKVIEDAGYSTVIYGDYETLTKSLDNALIPYNIWYVRYGVGNKFKHRTMWQCTDSAKVDGIPGFVCLEFCFADYTKLFPGTGWRKINGIWYYYEEYQLVKNTSIEIDGKTYRFNKNGEIISKK
ncbi:MAG: GH25 family lysozyme [Hungatella hathewayi]|uniref:Glycoside hydrolase n=1 Tax=Hungatella hathewayi WAL-18680 TaxID=742737 RepID=G5IES2_9FIRM|nr:GH25 family lysozyme [Hungatella hathewayi]EHI60015.1 hypothetical protein HMPREF9473_01999 [ [Hungatella hathewayi WAL-18680]MBS4984421.1 glycoside hydrolase [Hungatella hathewayi]